MGNVYSKYMYYVNDYWNSIYWLSIFQYHIHCLIDVFNICFKNISLQLGKRALQLFLEQNLESLQTIETLRNLSDAV